MTDLKSYRRVNAHHTRNATTIKYRCIVCLSEWLSTTPPKKCPFCDSKADKIEVAREDD